jgi:hypothetical protein
VVVVPGLVGLFWGAPLVARELEEGTFRVVWTQSVTRRRWLLTRLAVLGLVATVASALLSLVVTWWSSPIDRAKASPFSSFDVGGVVPVGYALFALVLGVAAGLVLRRTVAGMAVALVGFVAARLAVKHGSAPPCSPPGISAGPSIRRPPGTAAAATCCSASGRRPSSRPHRHPPRVDLGPGGRRRRPRVDRLVPGRDLPRARWARSRRGRRPKVDYIDKVSVQ